MSRHHSEHIGALIAAILEPAKAGGLETERAEQIYEDLMSSIASLGHGAAFDALLNDILIKWAKPLMH